MGKNTMNYSHVLEFDEEKRILTINRLFKDGTRQLFTTVQLPSKTFSEDEKGFRDFAQKLGENLLIDSPVVKKLLEL